VGPTLVFQRHEHLSHGWLFVRPLSSATIIACPKLLYYAVLVYCTMSVTFAFPMIENFNNFFAGGQFACHNIKIHLKKKLI